MKKIYLIFIQIYRAETFTILKLKEVFTLEIVGVALVLIANRKFIWQLSSIRVPYYWRGCVEFMANGMEIDRC
jgi:hypothetical protein